VNGNAAASRTSLWCSLCSGEPLLRSGLPPGLLAYGFPANGFPANGSPASGSPADRLTSYLCSSTNSLRTAEYSRAVSWTSSLRVLACDPARPLDAQEVPGGPLGLPAAGFPANGFLAYGFPANGFLANGFPANGYLADRLTSYLCSSSGPLRADTRRSEQAFTESA
jgi:hypothetical protein